MQKTLSQLSEEYFSSAADIDRMIEKYRKILAKAYHDKNYLKTYEIKRKLTILYDQKRDIITTAYTLKNYYDDAKESRSA